MLRGLSIAGLRRLSHGDAHPAPATGALAARGA
jgi:hypothetical protein